MQKCFYLRQQKLVVLNPKSICFHLLCSVMNSTNCSSYSSSNVWGKHNPSVNFCSGGGCRSITVTPTCYCGDKSMLRTAKTTKNKGKRFWGCPNFKVMLICNLCKVFVFVDKDMNGIFGTKWR